MEKNKTDTIGYTKCFICKTKVRIPPCFSCFPESLEKAVTPIKPSAIHPGMQVKCIHSTGLVRNPLTEGRIYTVLHVLDSRKYIMVKSDNGVHKDYLLSRFEIEPFGDTGSRFSVGDKVRFNDGSSNFFIVSVPHGRSLEEMEFSAGGAISTTAIDKDPNYVGLSNSDGRWRGYHPISQLSLVEA